LQAAQLQVNNDKFDLNKVVDVYQSKLQSLQLTQSSLDRYLAHGANVLISLFEDKGFELPKSGQPEVSFSEVNLDTVRLNGVLDHVYVDHNKLVISDYKTGNTLSSFYTKDQTKVIKAWRQKTQLLYYCLLARQSGRFKSITEYEGQIIYVESENSKGMTLSLKPTNEELDQLEHLIKAVWQRIQNLDFSLPSGLDDTIDSIQKFQAYLINQ
jgi:ATP-dependent exoDNAse (exonuclease V) beta subunit